ncbi:MAG: hypothetical protein HKP57_10230 [Halobacteria archaeon]|nr:hypothetical protein [Halobacteria archaeon]
MDLDLPQRKKPDLNSTVTRPDVLRDWVERLPLLNTEKTRQLLVDALERINRLDMSPDDRNESLEILTTSVMCVVDALKKEFLGKPMPLDEKHSRQAEQALDLCNRMATGYRIMADDLGQDEAQNRQLGIAIHRSLRYLSEILLGHYQIYRQYPEGLWRSIHALYALAEECGINRLSITDTTLPTSESSNIETIYKQILLLSLACPYRLRQKEIHFAYNALIDWASFCRLSQPGTRMETGLFSVNIHSDDPPAYRNLHTVEDSDIHHSRILDASAIAHRLRAALENESRNQTGFGNRDTLQQLILAWGAMPKRRFPRHRSTDTLPVKLVVGLNTIHRLVSGPQTQAELTDETIMDYAWLRDPTFDRPVEIEIDPYLARDQTTMTVEETQRDVQRGAYMAADAGVPHVEFWKIADMSAAGYCLLWENSEASSACVGELVAIINQQEEDRGTWQLGVIRWMKFNPEHGLELGIQMLSPGAQAVWAYLLNDDIGRNVAAINKMQGILLPGIEAIGQVDSLILPCLPFRTGSSSILEIDNETRDIVLSRQLENTGRFAQYHYELQTEEQT